MLFHSQDFLELYVVAFVGYWLLRGQRLRMGWILLASLAFYAAWNPWLLPLILLVAALGYGVARGIDASHSAEHRRRLVILGITASLGILGFFKYTNFFLGSVQAVLGPLGDGGAPSFFDIVLPLGISFYTFETICYMVDVYRGNTRAERSRESPKMQRSFVWCVSSRSEPGRPDASTSLHLLILTPPKTNRMLALRRNRPFTPFNLRTSQVR